MKLEALLEQLKQNQFKGLVVFYNSFRNTIGLVEKESKVTDYNEIINITNKAFNDRLKGILKK